MLPLAVTLTFAFGAPADPGDQPWRPPLERPPRVARPFDPPARPWLPGHRGVDLTARPGEPVLAAGDGRVLYAGMFAGRGVVSIVHGKLRTTYEPVVPSVHAGQPVSAGDRIGVVAGAPSHCSPRTCLHWGLLRGDDYLSPLGLIGRGPLRLLPVWGVPTPYGVRVGKVSPELR